MSTFGSPGGQQKLYQPKPPERGSFPLDHDGECRHLMLQYLDCIRRARGYNERECRVASKGYLECRMERGLMARDTAANLGYAELATGGGPDQDTDDRTLADARAAGAIVDGALGRAVRFGGAKKAEQTQKEKSG